MAKQTSRSKGPRPPHPARSAREAALDVLIKVEKEHAYSNLALNHRLQESELSRQDVALTTELVYGTIQRLNTIDYFLSRFVSKGLQRLEPWVRQLLRLSFYQLYYLDRVPDHAAVNEAVTIAKRRGHQGISGMVNAILRNVLRQREQLVIPQENAVERISLEHSHPAWLVQRWIDQFGEQITEQVCAANNEAPHVSVRVNRIRTNRMDMLQTLQMEQLLVEPSKLSDDGIIVHNGGNMALSTWFEQGDFSIQDESSMLVAQIASPSPGMTVLDCCAAPGGKTSHMAEIMNNEGRIIANDIHEHKKLLIDKQAERLGLTIIETIVSDAEKLHERFDANAFDLILLDAPCTGWGVIRRKPEIKWQRQEADLESILKIQYRILQSIHRLIKPGGVLVYSTCTIEQSENQGMVERFLRDHPEFQLDSSMQQWVPQSLKEQAQSGMVQILPQQFGSDGFFIARMKKS